MSLTLRNYLRLHNNSGEDLTEAEVSIGYGADFKKTIAHEEVLEMLSERIEGVAMRKVLTWDAATLPWDPEYRRRPSAFPLSYVITNNKPPPSSASTRCCPARSAFSSKQRSNPRAEGEQAGEGVTFTGEDWAHTHARGSRDETLHRPKPRRESDAAQDEGRQDEHSPQQPATTSCCTTPTRFTKSKSKTSRRARRTSCWSSTCPVTGSMVENSHAAQFEKKDAFTFEYNLTLPANTSGEKKTVVTFNINRLNVQGNEPTAY